MPSKSTITPPDSGEVYGLAAPPPAPSPFTASMPETIGTPIADSPKPANPFTAPMQVAVATAAPSVAAESEVEKPSIAFPSETVRTSVTDSPELANQFAAPLPVVAPPLVNSPTPALSEVIKPADSPFTPETIIETEEGKSAHAKREKGLTFDELAEEEALAKTGQSEGAPHTALATDDSESSKSEVAKIGWMSSPNALKTATQQENPEAMFYFGYFSLQGYLHNGISSEQSKRTAAQCFTQGAKFAAQDSAAGLCCAGLCSESGSCRADSGTAMSVSSAPAEDCSGRNGSDTGEVYHGFC